MITVVDCGISNIGSVLNMLRYLGVPAEATADPARVRTADRLILPGIGSFDAGMARLEAAHMIEALNHSVLERRVPILGICLGMQIMLEGSEEGGRRGLGWIPGTAVRFRRSPEHAQLRVPHMGWSEIEVVRPNPLLEAGDVKQRFYFVHSYYASCADDSTVVAVARHGVTFTAALQRDNVMGVQFHPEKSHRFGMRLLASFSGANSC